ncbi:PREDICTED: transcription factor E2F8-like [Priapulus caudatus]|uniref:Transcription factor E2F8-like n=1 Tax=Priapulus caudatus TaxID=37621 RepID=A0ABM1EZ17_PRICU|nr:PREDICTED: transcription factor E2F8-like [Priapulus caudatus]XP_014677438.1 PREDICTED: transcription factor E2F8-like [Priapulus caudatus]
MSTEFEHISLLPMQCGDNFDTEVSNTNFDPSAAGYQDFTSAPFSALPPLLRHADESNPGFTRTGKMCSDRLPAQAAQAPQPLWQQQRTDVRASGDRSQLIAGGSSAGPSVGGGLKRPLWDSTNTVTRGATLRVEGTPTKTLIGSQLDPLTPTANLKLLFSAMSPEIRNRDSKKKKQLFDECSGDVAASVQEAAGDGGNEAVLEGCEGGAFIEDAIFKTSRKDKSLRLLCMRFLAMFPNDTSVQISMCLDKIAKQLCTERRRIYDIVNVLESVEIVSRQAKNQYSWHGRAQLTNTLLKLKELARRERYDRLLEAVLEYEPDRTCR